MALSAVLASCTKDNTAIDQPMIVAKDKIYASIGEGEEEGTRVQLNADLQSVWTAGDEITIFGPKEYSQWSFDGKTGDRVGVFSLVEAFEPMLDKVNKYYAVYPGLGNIDYSQTTAANAELITELKATQTYTEGTYCPKSNVMFGSSEDGSSYLFKNVVSYLRLSITGGEKEPSKVKSIDVLGNNGETFAGRLYVNTETELASFRGDDVTTTDMVTLDCGDGVQLSATPTDFYFVVPASPCYKGITVCVNFTDGTSYLRSTTKSIAFNPNRIYPMAVFSTDEEVEWQCAYFTHHGERVATPQVGGSSAVSGCVIWGDGNVTMLGGDSDYRYQDGKDEHVITLQVSGAHQFELKHCTGISHIDLTNF